MKRFTLSILSIFALALVACGGASDSFVKAEKALKDGIAAIEASNSLEQVQAIADSLQINLNAIAAETGDEMSAEESEKLDVVAGEFAKVIEAKATALIAAEQKTVQEGASCPNSCPNTCEQSAK